VDVPGDSRNKFATNCPAKEEKLEVKTPFQSKHKGTGEDQEGISTM
jgi:hypothetical protein